MNFCSHCGAPVGVAIPPGDSLPRHVCTTCGMIHYQNPKLVVGCIAESEGQILLCRRAIEPRHGLWTLPAGFMENGETTAAAAARETREEACAEVRLEGLFALVNVAYIHQVHLFYHGRLVEGRHAPGFESLETRLFAESELPWNEMAFRSNAFALRAWLADRRSGNGFALHSADLEPA